MNHPTADETDTDYKTLYLQLRKRFEREKRIRREAEQIAERGLRELYSLNNQQKLLEMIVSCANTTSSATRVLEVTLEESCRRMGFSGGVAFIRREDGNYDRVNPTLCFPDTLSSRQALLDACRASRLFEADGLAFQIKRQQKIVSWKIDSHDHAIGAGLHYGLGLPVIADGCVDVLILFFSCKEVKAEEPIVGLCMNIGGHIARVIEREKAERKLRYDATHDALTNLPNRTLFIQTLTDILATWKTTDTPPAVCLMDLDHFKHINDTAGHLVGDQVLCQTAQRLKHTLADHPAHMVARLGGDEFVILFYGKTSPHEVIAATENVCDVFRRPLEIENHSLISTASIGLAFWSSRYKSTSCILKEADQAMYVSKRAGGGRVTLASPVNPA
ncbi:GGDEF domain-containing protein [Acetobacter sp. UBA5411]|uniref:GGDEF domain-containing protein n=1 Tax=Acetobacter sp. UBA5411 TaxID=1945905 RepID=UPI0025BC5710|nr:GGDEF domain-containing protein [Acetobacter sp. UBA5411]